jgi:stage V sporulation protein R
MVGIEFLWGAPVQLETSEAVIEQTRGTAGKEGGEEADITWQRVVYTMREKVLSRQVL